MTGSGQPGRPSIVFFVSSMHGGGAERVAALLCNDWAERGYAVTLVATYSRGGTCSHALHPDVQLVHLADRLRRRPRWLFSRLRRVRAMRAEIKRHAPAAVVSFLPVVNVATLVATIGLPVPVVVSERIYPPALPLPAVWRWLRRRTYPRARAVVVQTRQALDWLHREIPAAHGRVIANPCVMPLPQAEPRVPPDRVLAPDRRVVLTAGRLAAQKDVPKLVSAFARLAGRQPDWDLVILGEGEQRAEIEALCAAHGVGDRVHLPGYAGNMAAWYRRAEVFALSSRFEGFPNTLMEAMAHGLPVVAVDCTTGPGDLVRHEVDGLLVAPEAGASGVAAALERLITAPERRARLGRAARSVRARFAPADVSRAWLGMMGVPPPR